MGVPGRLLAAGFACVLAAASAAAGATGGRIEGRLLLAGGEALPGVRVTVAGTDLAAVTDGEGRFVIRRVPAGTYEVELTLGKDSLTIAGVEVGEGRVARLDRTLGWDVSRLETVTVYGASRRREPLFEAPVAASVVPEEQIEREGAHGEAPRLIAYEPGVELTQSGLFDFNVNLRGFNSSLNRRVLTLMDGRDPTTPIVGYQEWASIPFALDDLSSVEVIRGPGSALYGANAYNGVINFVTKDPRYSQGGSIRLTVGQRDTRRVDSRYAGQLGEDWFYRFQAGYSGSDDFYRSRTESVEYRPDLLSREALPLPRDRTEIEYGGVRFDRYFSRDRMITLEGAYSQVRGQAFLSGIGRVQYDDYGRRPWLRFQFQDPRWNVLAYWDGRTAERISLRSGAHLYDDTGKFHAEVLRRFDFADGKGHAVAGASFRHLEMNTADPRGVETILESPTSDDQPALFGQLDYRFNDRVRGVLAGRWDDSRIHAPQFSPRAGLVFTLAPTQKLRINYSRAFQSPAYTDKFLYVVAAPPLDLSAIEADLGPQIGDVSLGFGNVPVLAVGNQHVDVETVRSLELGYSGVLADRLLLTVDAYHSRFENFITDLLPQVGTSLGRINPDYGPYEPPASLTGAQRQAVLDALRDGVPASVFDRLSNASDGSIIMVAASYANFGKVDTQGVDLGLNWRLTRRWGLAFTYSWFDFDTKQDLPDQPIVPNAPENKATFGLTYAREGFDLALRYRWVDGFFWSAGLSGPVPSYNVVDLYANYDITDHLTLGLNVQNLLDDRHWELFGGDLLTRYALTTLAFRW